MATTRITPDQDTIFAGLLLLVPRRLQGLWPRDRGDIIPLR